MAQTAKQKKARVKAQIEAKKPRKWIGGDVLSKDDERSLIDKFLHRQACRAYRTYSGLLRRQGTTEAEDWLYGQIVYWRHVTGTIEMMRAWNYPQGWRKR